MNDRRGNAVVARDVWSGTRALRAALLLGLPALIVALCGCSQVLGPQYEYEEDLELALDGRATLYINASVPALVALRGMNLSTGPTDRLDRARVRALYESPLVHVVRVSTSRRAGRRFVHVRLEIEDVRRLTAETPFAWSAYRFEREADQYVFSQVVSGPALRQVGNVGWRGDELVAFRLHLPSKIRYHDAPSKRVERGNILTWDQPLAARLSGEPLHMEARIETQSILYRTIALFASTVVLAVVVLCAFIWWLSRVGRGSEESMRGVLP